MASILLPASFLAGSIISLLIPVALLIGLGLWHLRAIHRIPQDPAQRAAHAAGTQEAEGHGAPSAEGTEA